MAVDVAAATNATNTRDTAAQSYIRRPQRQQQYTQDAFAISRDHMIDTILMKLICTSHVCTAHSTL